MLATATVGVGLTVTVTAAELLQPVALVPVTVYVVFVAGETEIVFVVGPVFQV